MAGVSTTVPGATTPGHAHARSILHHIVALMGGLVPASLLPELPVKAEGHDEERFLFAQLLAS